MATATIPLKGSASMESKKVSISSKRQITIPQKFFTLLGFNTEAECIMRGNELVLRPVKENTSGPVSLPDVSLLLLRQFFSLYPQLSAEYSPARLFFPALPSQKPFPLSLLFVLHESELLPLLSQQTPVSVPLSASPVYLPEGFLHI